MKRLDILDVNFNRDWVVDKKDGMKIFTWRLELFFIKQQFAKLIMLSNQLPLPKGRSL